VAKKKNRKQKTKNKNKSFELINNKSV